MALLTPYWSIDVILLLISLIFAAYLYMTRHFNHWKKKGVLEIPPIPFIGNFLDCCLFRMSMAEYLRDLYNLGKDLPYIGFYLFDKPILVLRDPDIIKQILTKDFHCFWDRYASTVETDVMGTQNLFFLKNPAWKNMRQKLTPVFSSGKVKGMLPLVSAVGDDLLTHFNNLEPEDGGAMVDLREICARYTTDVIGTCAFGLKVNCLNNPDAEFRKNGHAIFEHSYRRGLELMSVFFIPGLIRPLGFTVFGTKSERFIRKIFYETFDERLKSGIRRNDLIDLLIDLQKSQAESNDPNALKFDGDCLAAQAAVFFAAGFETSSSTMSFTLHELSLNPEIQTKFREEIKSARKKHGSELSYEMIQDMPYLDHITSETLRKYPALPFLDRVAHHDYTISKTGLQIEKGTPVYVPMLGLHYDAEYFPDPDKYDPERFNEDNKRKFPNAAYLPFGDGPHNCIGLRLGVMQVKIGLIKVISNYEIIPCEKTLNPMRFDAKALIISSEGGLYHRIRKISVD